MDTKDSNPLLGYKEWTEYMIDAGQRTVLYWDVMRRRGNQYLERMAVKVPHVLQFNHHLILDGRTLPRPVNYGIIKIDPPEGTVIDERKRPFVVIDPRRDTARASAASRPTARSVKPWARGMPVTLSGLRRFLNPGRPSRP